jgi:hypothetical protein
MRMMFDEVLTTVLDLLQRQGHMSSRALKQCGALNDDYALFC